jgi:endonuclease/exonuclease/phosphatase family metal-dependent hydrolase
MSKHMRVLVLVAATAIGLAANRAGVDRVKLAFFNIKSGQGAPALRGHAPAFVETNDCDPSANRPLNAWGTGVVQRELRRLADDREVVALGLAEAWNCGSPGKVTRALGWKHHTEERNGTGLITRYGIAGKDEWIQLDTSRNKNPKDAMYVVRAAVCLDESCGSTLDVYMTHWYGTGPESQATLDKQAEDSVRFMSQSRGPHALLGDLNVFEGSAEVCHQRPNNSTLGVLRRAGYVDAWAALHPGDPGYTGMLNRAGCGSPEGAPWKRIDYAWSKGLTPIAIERFGLPEPGADAPSDHTGIVATYKW